MSGAERISSPWTPAGADPEAARAMWTMLPRERIGAVRRLAYEAIRSDDRAVRAVAYLLIETAANYELSRFASVTGIALAGSAGQHKRSADLVWRDAALRRLTSSPPFAGTAPREAARRMIDAFARYKSRSWPRDRRSGLWPEAGPDAVFCEMLRRPVRMPGLRQLLSVLTSEVQ